MRGGDRRLAFRLARQSGIWNVDALLASMPQALLEEWRVFEDLDPNLDTRLDWGLAHVVQALIRDGKPLRDFMLGLGDYPKHAAPKQTVEYQEMLLDAWIIGNNATFKEKESRAT